MNNIKDWDLLSQSEKSLNNFFFIKLSKYSFVNSDIIIIYNFIFNFFKKLI